MAEQKLDGKKKFAIIGSSSAGKTTLSLRILADLKRLGVLVDGVLQQDRRLCFDRDLLETDIEAQYVVIFNMVCRESEMLLKRGVEVVISDRSVLDFYAYFEEMYGRYDYIWKFVLGWCETYEVLYYLERLNYHDDGNRPPEDFVERVDQRLRNLIAEILRENDLGSCNINLQIIPREKVYEDILHRIKRLMTREEMTLIPEVLGQDCLVGGSYAFNRATRHSDVDVYICTDTVTEVIPELSRKMRGVFGANIEVRGVTQPIYDYYKNDGFLEFKYTGKPLNNLVGVGGDGRLPLPQGGAR